MTCNVKMSFIHLRSTDKGAGSPIDDNSGLLDYTAVTQNDGTSICKDSTARVQDAAYRPCQDAVD